MQERRTRRIRLGYATVRTLRRAALGLALFGVASTPIAAAEESAEGSSSSNPSIRFVDLGGIEDWRVAEDGSLLIEGRNRNWFRATFFGPCTGIRFASAIGFVTDSTGSLDRFSSILVDGERCYFRSLEKIEPPELEPRSDE